MKIKKKYDNNNNVDHIFDETLTYPSLRYFIHVILFSNSG